MQEYHEGDLEKALEQEPNVFRFRKDMITLSTLVWSQTSWTGTRIP